MGGVSFLPVSPARSRNREGYIAFFSFTHPPTLPRFLVLTGRNGSGKSTVCDAIEFVLTGTIGKYSQEKGGKESLSDYFWWRGAGQAESHHVTLEFEREGGDALTVTRSREKGVPAEQLRKLEQALCDEAAKPPDALAHLCRTSIIRDELIAASSLDLSDPARFEFVRSALGAIAHGDAGPRVHDAALAAQASLTEAEKAAELASSRLRTTLAELADARAAAARAADLETALAVVRRATGEAEADVLQVLAAARRHLAERRAAFAQAEPLSAATRQLEEQRRQVRTEEFQARQTRANEERDRCATEFAVATDEMQKAESALVQQRESNAAAASLSVLLEHGSRLGLDGQRCPLCGAHREQAEWDAALKEVASRVAAISTALADATAKVAALRPVVERARANLARAANEFADCERLTASLDEREDAIRRQWDDFIASGAKVTSTGIPTAESMETRLARERDELIEVERSMLVLEASQAVERVSRLEAVAETTRAEVDAAGNRVAAAQTAAQALDAAEKAVRRVNAEIVDERLASISPLLSELYYRLRPHENWREIDYAIRGDVRRFLSLRVGEGLNPQFIFSSGQRRAAGLAFLLAVHLSRPWCDWRTLVLDDPVQHIDDFRALQLVEVLSALRKSDRQVICAVEDSSLADVLCRRLRSTESSPGARIELDYDVEEGSHPVSCERVKPFPRGILNAVGGS